MAAPDASQSGSNVPIPDPTARTLEQSKQAIDALKELQGVRIDGLESEVDRVRAQVGTEIGHLTRLMDEKFKGVADQFASNAVALAAALLAQKTSVDEQNKSNALAVSKSDAAVTKQIDAIGAQISATAKATDDKIDDLKSRVQSIEGHSKGSSDTWGYFAAAAGLVIAAVTVIVMLASRAPEVIQVPAGSPVTTVH